MPKSAETYVEPNGQPVPNFGAITRVWGRLDKFRYAIIFGVGSITLYALMYLFSADLITIAQNTHKGHKGMFFVPIIIALVFSVVHGKFTAHFWDSLGVKAKS